MPKLLSLLGFPILVVGVLALLRLGALLASAPILIAAQIAAAGLMIWARITFGLRSFHPGANPTAGGLVTVGPYRFIRHPIYASICFFCIAGVIGHWSIAAAFCLLVVFAGALIRMIAEERILTLEYPGYGAYAARTNRIVPGLY